MKNSVICINYEIAWSLSYIIILPNVTVHFFRKS